MPIDDVAMRNEAVQSSGRLPSLDGFRAVSIALVLASHAASTLHQPRNLYVGDLGVRCFFVISGFIITHLLLEEEKKTGGISLRLFYARRCLRIMPVYFLFVLCLAIINATTSLHLPLCNFATALTYTKDFACGQWIDGHLWSLSVEEQFYLLWPLILVTAAPKQRMIVAIALICICPLFRVAYYVSGVSGAFSLFTNADALMFGCVAATLLHRHRPAMVAALEFWPTVGRVVALCLIAVPIFVEAHFWLGFLTVPFARTAECVGLTYLIVSYTFVPVGIGYRVLNLSPMRFLGVISYSLYIWQQPFFSRPSEYGLENVPLLELPWNVMAAFAVANLSYFSFERPLVRLRHRLRPVAVGPLPITARSL
jgi:peptidoglycan/LPS O-acetylase OafA/YrhL